MRIALNLLYLIPGRVGGTETYGLSLMHALSDVDRESDYFVFLNREATGVAVPSATNFHRVDCAVSAIHRSLRYGWEQIVLPRQLRELKIDLVHSPGYVAPLMNPCASVVTIPDLNFRAIRKYLPLQKRLLLAVPRFFSARSARRAERVITISNFSKKEITAGLGLDPGKVAVTYLGPRRLVAGRAEPPWSSISESYGLPSRYIVAFGGGSRHKNIPRLLSAFRAVKDSCPHALVMLGHIPADVDIRRESACPGMSGRLLSLGYVPEQHVSSILAHADLFVLPSLYEGFGLPVLEAQQAEVAVACSTAGSLPEVAGLGAVYFDPLSTEALAAAIRQCLADPDLRERLRARGRENVSRFTWESTAAQTLEVYRQVALKRGVHG
jgi:glycosyltransferase involved in cell wall biosynthesis